jgi:hypothetical protein
VIFYFKGRVAGVVHGDATHAILIEWIFKDIEMELRRQAYIY